MIGRLDQPTRLTLGMVVSPAEPAFVSPGKIIVAPTVSSPLNFLICAMIQARFAKLTSGPAPEARSQISVGNPSAALSYCSLAYSAFAAMRMGMSGSASFHRVRKSL
jgi:hypothetical protein